MSIISIYIFSTDGNLILFKNYKKSILASSTSANISGILRTKILRTKEPSFALNDSEKCSIFKCADVLLCACASSHLSDVTVFEILNCLKDIFLEYCGSVSEKMLSDNLLLIYELLEEFMDDGHVQISSSRGMKPFIINQPITRSIFSSLEFPNIKPFGTDHVSSSSSSPPPLPLSSSSSSVATTRSSSTVMTMQKTPTDISKTSSPSSPRRPAASTSSSLSLPKTKTTAAVTTTTSSQKYDIYVDVIESYDVIIGNGKNDQQQQQQYLSGKLVTRSNVPAGNSRVIIKFDHDIRFSDGDEGEGNNHEDRPLAPKNDINRLEKCHFYSEDVDVSKDQLNNIKSISYSVGDNDEHIVMTYYKQMNGHQQQQQQPPFTLACKQTSIPNSKDVSVSLTLTFNGHNNNNNNYNNNNNNNKSGSSSSSSMKVVKCVVSIPLSTLVKEVTFENQPSQQQQYTLVHCNNNKQQNNDVIVDSKQQRQPTDDGDIINERQRGCIQTDEILNAKQDNINSKQQNHLDVINDEEQHNNDVINEEQPHSINNKLIWNLNSALQVNQPISVKFKLVVEQMTSSSSSSSPSTTTSSSSPLLGQALIDFELSGKSSVSGLKISSINMLDSINQPANQPVTRHRQPQHQYNKWIRYIITSGLYAVNLD
ncbi:hypothetical protein HELRODRAFT_193777 [Helobdella robusta]|uniref:AP complex mu/sigma subunit domain-containing protein n=1 Tax=Helobdella robusta TaxID=6412 RepID=T1FVC4_HELRO|nr:hypothetical protein HELRODRAFT_193777 [Helobdella robusta]ESN94755.1 hypothetical protein HELRODRAFT_193777 [Helobdella robusta]